MSCNCETYIVNRQFSSSLFSSHGQILGFWDISISRQLFASHLDTIASSTGALEIGGVLHFNSWSLQACWSLPLILHGYKPANSKLQCSLTNVTFAIENSYTELRCQYEVPACVSKDLGTFTLVVDSCCFTISIMLFSLFIMQDKVVNDLILHTSYAQSLFNNILEVDKCMWATTSPLWRNSDMNIQKINCILRHPAIEKSYHPR